MQPNQRGVIRVSKQTALIVGIIVGLVGVYLGWLWFKPEPAPRTVVMRHLKFKTKPKPWTETVDVKLREAPTPWLDLPKLLEADEEYAAMYRHLAAYVVYADQLLRAKEQGEQLKGMQLAMACIHAATAYPQDEWLAARMCEAFLLPNLKLMESKPGVATRDQLLSLTIQAIQRTEDTDGQILVFRKIAAREQRTHEGDWARSQAANLLSRAGKYPEAAVLLEEIKDPRRKTWWGRRLSDWQKPAVKKAPAPTNPAPKK